MSEPKFEWQIKSHESLFKFNFKQIIEYKDLFWLLIRRDFIAFYKQTVLGPLWFFIQPIITLFAFSFIFGRIGGISTNQLPKPLFYLPGIICWNYFSECVIKTSSVFKDNANLFSKVYFPRILLPLSIVVSSFVRFGIQFILLIGLLIYYQFQGFPLNFGTYIYLIPVVLLTLALLGLSLGLIISALTTKYRDLSMLLNFGMQLLMYSTTVVYPLSAVPSSLKKIVEFNPMTSLLETFRFSITGLNTFSLPILIYAMALTLVLVSFGYILFNKVERDFVDTI